MYIPKLKSLADLLLWVPRFVYNLGFGPHAFLITILALLPIYLTTTEKRHTPKGEIVKIEAGGYMSTGNFEDNADSIYLRRGVEIRLLANQSGAFWAETTDGKYRGFVKPKTVGLNEDKSSLPTREKFSCRLISEKKFTNIVERLSLEKIQRKYLNAEYIKTRGGKTIVEFGFKVFVDNEGQKLYKRPIVTYNKEGEYLSHKLVFWQYAHSNMVSEGLVDLVGPMASVSEFPRVSPFESLLLEKMWCYLPGFLLLGIFTILLVLRVPLVWAPNPLVNLILYTLALIPPAMWLSVVKSYRLAGWFTLFYVVVMLVNVLLLWSSFSGLRCPKCKHLNYHELSGKRKGRTYWEKHRKAHEQSRGPVERERWGNWEVGKHSRESGFFSSVMDHSPNPDPNKWEIIHFREHSWEQKVTFRDYITHSHIQEVINSYKCPHCGHGTEDIEKSCVESNGEWENNTYTKRYLYTERVAQDGRVFDHKCTERK